MVPRLLVHPSDGLFSDPWSAKDCIMIAQGFHSQSNPHYNSCCYNSVPYQRCLFWWSGQSWVGFFRLHLQFLHSVIEKHYHCKCYCHCIFCNYSKMHYRGAFTTGQILHKLDKIMIIICTRTHLLCMYKKGSAPYKFQKV